MKKVILIGFLIMGLIFQGMSQDVLFKAKLKKDAVPKLVTDAIERDFPDFTIRDISAIPIEFESVADEVIINRVDESGDYNTYEIKIRGKGRMIDVTYDKEGNLLSSYEYLDDIPLPKEITKKLAIVFPGWAITKSNYKLVNYKGTVKTERYKAILTKGNKKKTVYLDKDGNVIKAI